MTAIATPSTALKLSELERIARYLNPPLADLIWQILTAGETDGEIGDAVVRVDLRLLNLTTV